jgi:hypothetical protein
MSDRAPRTAGLGHRLVDLLEDGFDGGLGGSFVAQSSNILEIKRSISYPKLSVYLISIV